VVNVDVTVMVSASASIEVAATGIVILAAKTEEAEAGGKIAVAEGGTLEVQASGVVEVQAQAALTVAAADEGSAGTLKVAGLIDVKESATVEVSGTLTAAGGEIAMETGAEVAVSGTIDGTTIATTGEGVPDLSGATQDEGVTITDGTDKELVYVAEGTVADVLAAAITTAKAVADGKGVVQLTEAFYTEANKLDKLVIDAGTDNEDHYTIRGLGKTGTALTVGVLLANDNVTLEQVKIEVAGVAKAVKTHTVDNSYFAALAIIRASDGSTISPDEENNHVTVRDCDISYSTSASMAAGVFVSGKLPNDVNITGNTISVTHSGQIATQGIAIRLYSPGVNITGNTITSSNATSGGVNDTPASALLLQIAPSQTNGAVPNIKENTLDGEEFDFYVAIYNHGGSSFVGDTALFGDKFGTEDTTWATAEGETGSFYKKLLTDLQAQVKGGTGDGFGRFLMKLGAGAADSSSSTNFALEYYEISDGAITAINYWSPGIEGQAYKNTAMASESNSTNVGVRARLPLNEDDENTTFHWTRTAEGTNLPGT
jgi:hypothetical protein